MRMAPSREDLAEALEQVDEGKIPKDSLTLQMLHEEMIRWPNLETNFHETSMEDYIGTKPFIIDGFKEAARKIIVREVKSTDTGIDPKEAAKRLNVDCDSAAAIEEADETGVASKAMGYGALYLVSSFPVIIGISVVFILFYNSLQ
ncbi:unnamed protein product [Brassica napus]|uniref:Uncharacterized protein n=2 Tax=Brassica TaxID=3705 RepID=A0A0D3AU47_BRAOL|nr:unnamed protein product [Brassica napus]